MLVEKFIRTIQRIGIVKKKVFAVLAFKFFLFVHNGYQKTEILGKVYLCNRVYEINLQLEA